MRTLFVSDLDGTLLDSQALVAGRSAEMLNRAIKNGVLFTVATARTPATVDVLMANVTMNLPAIVMTGAAWWDFAHSAYSEIRKIAAGDVRAVLAEFGRSAITPFIYTIRQTDVPQLLDVYYPGLITSAVDADFIAVREGLPLKKFHIDTLLPLERVDDVLLFFASGERETLRELAARIVAVTGCSVSCYDDVYHPDKGLIEVFAPGVSKAEAIRKMRRLYDIDRVVVFGDNLNDLPMFDVADWSVAVSNAVPEVRRRADEVIGANTDNAVASYILAHSSRQS